jgi:hypothetical protein
MATPDDRKEERKAEWSQLTPSVQVLSKFVQSRRNTPLLKNYGRAGASGQGGRIALHRKMKTRNTMNMIQMILVAAIFFPFAAHARDEALPYPYKGNCGSGYTQSGSFCTPTGKSSKPAVPRPAGANCPVGFYASGDACVKN